jgi:uncharacterized protein (TIGR00730 family)
MISLQAADGAPVVNEEQNGRRRAAIHASPMYRLAEDDREFMESDDARASRLALEFLRADLYLRKNGINSTVVVFGSARVLSPEVARANLAAVEQSRDTGVSVEQQAVALARARTALELSRYYDEARSLAAALTRRDPCTECHDFVIATGGGPGIMEGANRGAAEIGAPTIGFNIRLPAEQEPNPYITPTLALHFHYFALRKMHFLLRARALVAFPGGYGTLDELFEALNLVQTGTIKPIPIVLVGAEFWRRAIDFDFLKAQGFISAGDVDLFRIVETGAEAARHILDFHRAT